MEDVLNSLNYQHCRSRLAQSLDVEIDKCSDLILAWFRGMKRHYLITIVWFMGQTTINAVIHILYFVAGIRLESYSTYRMLLWSMTFVSYVELLLNITYMSFVALLNIIIIIGCGWLFDLGWSNNITISWLIKFHSILLDVRFHSNCLLLTYLLIHICLLITNILNEPERITSLNSTCNI